MSSNLKSHGGTENNALVQFINALEDRVKTLHPSVFKCVCSDSPKQFQTPYWTASLEFSQH